MAVVTAVIAAIVLGFFAARYFQTEQRKNLVQIGDTLYVHEPMLVTVQNIEPIITPAASQRNYVGHGSMSYGHFTVNRPADTLRFGERRGLPANLGDRATFSPRRTTQVIVIAMTTDSVLVRTITPIPGPVRYEDWLRYWNWATRPCPEGATFYLTWASVENMVNFTTAINKNPDTAALRVLGDTGQHTNNAYVARDQVP